MYVFLYTHTHLTVHMHMYAKFGNTISRKPDVALPQTTQTNDVQVLLLSLSSRPQSELWKLYPHQSLELMEKSQRIPIISGSKSSSETSRNFAQKTGPDRARTHVFVSRCWYWCSRRPLRCRSTCCWFPAGWRCRSRAPSTCPGPREPIFVWWFASVCSFLLVITERCIFSEHRVYPKVKIPFELSSYWCLVGNEGMIHIVVIDDHPIPPLPSIPC